MILDDLVAVTKKRIDREKEQLSLKELQQQAQQVPNKNPQTIIDEFLKPNLHFIGEIKQASP